MPQMSPMTWMLISLSPLMLMAISFSKPMFTKKNAFKSYKKLSMEKKWTW